MVRRSRNFWTRASLFYLVTGFVFLNFPRSWLVSMLMTAWLLPLFNFCFAGPTKPKEEMPAACITKDDAAETVPAPVKISAILDDIRAMRDVKGRVLFEKISPELEKKVRELFEIDPKKISKLEQFFGILYFLAKEKTLSGRLVEFDPTTARKLLLSTRVFSTPTVPNRLSAVTLVWSSYLKRASYEVKFSTAELRLPLNQGKGFANWREGMCQIARELIFYGGFDFNIQLTRSKGHVFVDEFKKLDLFGTFGSRGIADVDIQYVSVKSIEFLKGSPYGTVRAKVSPREFEVNPHSWVLKAITKLVTDKSTQPIDW